MLRNSTIRRTVEKIWPCSTRVGDGVEDQWTGGIEDGFIVVAIELAATEAAAGRETTGSICQIVG